MRDALVAGADDYVKKPFRTRELVARIKAKLRRAKPGTPLPPTTGIERQGGEVTALYSHRRAVNNQEPR
jgi:DNA-binding response OmpR family regulator